MNPSTIRIILMILIYLILGLYAVAHADTLIQGHTVDQYVEAIKHTENSKKFPYGIKSVACNTEDSCRKICAVIPEKYVFTIQRKGDRL